MLEPYWALIVFGTAALMVTFIVTARKTLDKAEKLSGFRRALNQTFGWVLVGVSALLFLWFVFLIGADD